MVGGSVGKWKVVGGSMFGGINKTLLYWSNASKNNEVT